MADGSISISLSEVSASSTNIWTINNELAVILENIKTKMNALSETWQSDGSETIRANFNKMSSSFEDYKTVIENYVTFLDDTVEAYTTTEASIEANADLFEV